MQIILCFKMSVAYKNSNNYNIMMFELIVNCIVLLIIVACCMVLSDGGDKDNTQTEKNAQLF